MKLKAAVIGTGRIGYLLQKDKKREQPASHAAALAKNPRIRLAAACDIDPQKLTAWSKDYPRTACYTSAETLMQTENPDLVVVAVSESAHTEVALTVIRYKPRLVILEKPVAPEPAAAEKIRKAAARFHVPVCVNHERRFSADYLTAKRIIDNGGLGTLQRIDAHLWSGAPVWSKTCVESGNCSLIHDGTHLVDTLHFLLSTRLSDPAADRIIRDKKKAVRVLNLHYHLPRNVLLYLEFNGQSKVFDFEITVTGSEGKLVIGNGYLKQYTRAPSPFYSGFYSLKRLRGVGRPRITGYFSGMVQNCVDFLAGTSPLVSPLSEGIRALKALFEIVACLQS